MSKSIEKRFWAKINKDGPVRRFLLGQCWEWTGYRKAGSIGYGLSSENNRHIYAHRLSWKLHHGEIPEGMCVLHRCDNPSCVRPSHLWLGTLSDNTHDMVEKGRSTNGDQRGERNGQAKLREDDIRAILKLHTGGMCRRDLSQMFGVCVSQIKNIVRREGWKHILVDTDSSKRLKKEEDDGESVD